MCAALRYFKLAVLVDSVYQSVFFVDMPAPVTREVFFQRFRLAYAFSFSVPLYVRNELVYFSQRLTVLLLPPYIFFPCPRSDQSFIILRLYQFVRRTFASF